MVSRPQAAFGLQGGRAPGHMWEAHKQLVPYNKLSLIFTLGNKLGLIYRSELNLVNLKTETVYSNLSFRKLYNNLKSSPTVDILIASTGDQTIVSTYLLLYPTPPTNPTTPSSSPYHDTYTATESCYWFATIIHFYSCPNYWVYHHKRQSNICVTQCVLQLWSSVFKLLGILLSYGSINNLSLLCLQNFCIIYNS